MVFLIFFQSKTSPTFIEHVVQIHPRARHVIEDLINLKRHQIDTKAVGSELPDHSSILEDVEDYINYGAKYLVFVSSRSIKMREFSFLSLYTF